MLLVVFIRIITIIRLFVKVDSYFKNYKKEVEKSWTLKREWLI